MSSIGVNSSSHLVHGHAQARLAHPAHQQVATALVLVGQGQPGEPASLGGTNPAEILHALLQALAIDPHVASQQRL
jgi:hypothetical protein